MGKALYRTHRSKSLKEVVGQDHITTTLQNSVDGGTFVHAYLFTGPRGVGKTSVARILAHLVNKVPYPADPPEIDIIEIDAASNRRIDEIRELRERVGIAPTRLSYKVYIIDEVHMLTREAFNALLKTLEEPPEHVIFILATTDAHKVPDTIVSRCVRFQFRPIEADVIAKHLQAVAKEEKIKITDEACQLIADHSDGSFRDGLALLDQLRGSKEEILPNIVEQLLGIASSKLIDTLLSDIKAGKPQEVLKTLASAREKGSTEQSVAQQVVKRLRSDITSANLELMSELVLVPADQDPRASLEIALLRASIKHDKPENAETNHPEPIDNITPIIQNEILDQIVQKKSSIVSVSSELPGNEEIWTNVLEELKDINRSLYGIARMAAIEVSDDKLTLHFKFGFHHKQMNQTKNKQLISDIVQKRHPKIQEVVVLYAPETTPVGESNETISNITNIFGAGEVLES